MSSVGRTGVAAQAQGQFPLPVPLQHASSRRSLYTIRLFHLLFAQPFLRAFARKRTVNDLCKSMEIITGHAGPQYRPYSPTRKNPNLYLDQPIIKWWCEPIKDHVSYPNNSPKRPPGQDCIAAGVYTKFSDRLSEEPFPWLIQKFPCILIFKIGQPGCQLNLSEGQIRLDLTSGRPLV